MHSFLLVFLLLSIWCAAKTTFSQIVELDLVFPRENETYASGGYFPFVWGVQNAAAACREGLALCGQSIN